MADLRTYTDQIISSADNIKMHNNYICDQFSELQTAMIKLDNCWDSPAATLAMSKFNELKTKFVDARYDVIDNYVNFLLLQVGEGYTQTEATNVSLADQFK